MKYLLTSFLLIFISCQHIIKPQINQTSWLPYAVYKESELNENSNFLNYSLTFSANDSLTIQTLGTDVRETYQYEYKGDSINYNIDDQRVNLQVLELTKNQLIFQLGAKAIYCIPFPDMRQNDLSVQIYDLLRTNSWLLNESTLLEFENSLDSALIKPHLHSQLADVKVHYRKEDYYPFHEEAFYGIAYQNNSNILVINDIIGSGIDRTLFLDSLNDSLMIANTYNYQGDLERDTLKVIKKSDVKAALVGKWRLDSYEEIKNGFGTIWDDFDYYAGLTETIMKNDPVDMVLNRDGTYSIETKGREIVAGTWKPTKSGQLIKLSTVYKGVYDSTRTTTYFIPISVGNNYLKILKTEDLQQEDGSFERKIFKSVYQRIE